MIQFLGTDLGLLPPADNDDATVMEALGVSKERAEQLAKQFADAGADSYVQVPSIPADMPGSTAFHLGRFMRVAQLDADRPNELLLIGYLMGATVTTIRQEEEQSLKRITKMMQLMATNPAKAHKKMLKDLKKRAKNGK